MNFKNNYLKFQSLFIVGTNTLNCHLLHVSAGLGHHTVDRTAIYMEKNNEVETCPFH